MRHSSALLSLGFLVAGSCGEDAGSQATPDAAVVDSDGDGVPDPEDAFPNDPMESVDTDGDGTGDNADSDDDGDGVNDVDDEFPKHPPVSCTVGTWSSWGVCSFPCAGGERKRLREIDMQAQFGGTCDDPAEETEPCNVDVTCACHALTAQSECEHGSDCSWTGTECSYTACNLAPGQTSCENSVIGGVCTWDGANCSLDCINLENEADCNNHPADTCVWLVQICVPKSTS